MTEPRLRMAGLCCAGLLLSALGTVQAAAPPHRHTEAATSWTGQPLLLQARGFSRSMRLLKPVGLQVDSAMVLPSVERGAAPVASQVPLREGKLAVRTSGPRQGGYYRVAAMQRTGAGARIASTVVYFSNPGPAPRAMLAHSAMPLEVVPASLPREHRHYRAGETWVFQLRAAGRPLAGHRVLFESAQGSHETLYTDDHGELRLTFPDDLPAPENKAQHGGHGGQLRSAFVLSARWRDADGRELLTAFNGDYRPGAYANKSLWLGGGFALLGMLAATPLLHRRKVREGVA